MIVKGKNIPFIQEFLNKKDYELFLNDLSALTGIKKKPLRILNYPVLSQWTGDQWSDFGPYGKAYLVGFDGPSSFWSKNTGFNLEQQKEITASLKGWLENFI